MPGSILEADTRFPHFDGGESAGEKIDQITDYLYMLMEQLRYSLANLDRDNFNDAGMEDIANYIREPVYLRLEKETEDISHMVAITADALISSIQDTNGQVSSLTQTINGMSLRVNNCSDETTISLVSNGAVISTTGAININGVVTFSDLEGTNTTTINGADINTGRVSSSNFRTLLHMGQNNQHGRIDGSLLMYYNAYPPANAEQTYNLAGEIRLDDQGSGTGEENGFRMFIGTKSVGARSFAMKLQSAAGMSLEAANIIYISSGTKIQMSDTEDISILAEDLMSISGDRVSIKGYDHTYIGNRGGDFVEIESDEIRLNGTVYINGTPLTP